MAHIIETAKSGRASCKVCKETIEKGDLRLGEEFPNPFSEGSLSYRWHHLLCGAKKKPTVLEQALIDCDLEVPDKDELLKLIQENKSKEKPTSLPYAEFASTGRSSCIQCGEKIEKGDLRIAVNTDTEAGAFGMRKGFLHPACAADFAGSESSGVADAQELFDQVKVNSRGLAEADFESVEAELFG